MDPENNNEFSPRAKSCPALYSQLCNELMDVASVSSVASTEVSWGSTEKESIESANQFVNSEKIPTCYRQNSKSLRNHLVSAWFV